MLSSERKDETWEFSENSISSFDNILKTYDLLVCTEFFLKIYKFRILTQTKEALFKSM